MKTSWENYSTYSDFRKMVIAEKKRKNRERLLDMAAGIGLAFVGYITLVVFLSL